MAEEYPKQKDFLIIAGPCSAESENQIMKTAEGISQCKQVKVFRAGIWKPRTDPDSFEGVGEKGLAWLQKLKEKTNLKTAVEVAVPEHIETCLKYENSVDIVWIGARTVMNPFSVQALADALKDTNFKVMIKNPLNPDIKLWSGAVERILRSGINDISIIHRGFYPFEKTELRNIPKWEIAIEMKSKYPEIPIICDPSHISGKREYIKTISQKALNLNYDGLMIETHFSPQTALSDSLQQITPENLVEILQDLKFRNLTSDNIGFTDLLEQYREQIDSIDFQMIELLAKRMKIVKKIGSYKLENNVTIFQLRRWLDIIKTRVELGKSFNLDEKFTKKILQMVHKESIKEQSEIMNGKTT